MDRAALDIALELGIAAGGWCPAGRRAEDGRIGDRYPLTESSSRQYAERTRLNVRDSDGTLILYRGEMSGGTAYTQRCAREHGRPLLVFNLQNNLDRRRFDAWLTRHRIQVLNVAGPRESQRPGIYEAACAALRLLLA